uniref:DUF1995 domain-containing protein n=1 Tax=Araucaria cunninghamii TaxID=56994 RepID=A0A0D6R810_ARACU
MAIAVPKIVQSLCYCSPSPSPSSCPYLIPSRHAPPMPIWSNFTNSRGSRRRGLHKFQRAAKYVRFEVSPAEEESQPDKKGDDSSDEMADDSVLPPNMEGAVLQSSQSSAKFIFAGGMRAIVELLLPELEFLNDEGSQEDLWQLARLYLESLRKETGVQQLKAIFPDAGAAALLKHWWKDANFSFASLSDRRPVEEEDEIVVMIAPDYQMLQSVEQIASFLSDDSPRPLVMWNPRLFSGDVGVGLNVRRLRQSFLSTFTVVYSIRPFPNGAVFRRYPGLWQVFLDDKERPGRYLLAREQPRRPNADELEIIFVGEKIDGEEEKPSFFAEAKSLFNSFNRFMRSLSK